ncbi:MAG: MM0924 family protein [Candidatus Helarchaeota archaeon]
MGLDKFISEHYINRNIEVYMVTKDTLSGKVIANADGVLTLQNESRKLTFIDVTKIVCLWEKEH